MFFLSGTSTRVPCSNRESTRDAKERQQGSLDFFGLKVPVIKEGIGCVTKEATKGCHIITFTN